MATAVPSTRTTRGPQETEALGAQLGAKLQAGDVVLLAGELGAGKTTFVRGLAAGLEVDSDQWVHSPSYTLLNEYRGRIAVYHFDLYRLQSESELADSCFFDYLDDVAATKEPGVVVVEWADRFDLGELREDAFCVDIAYNAKGDGAARDIHIREPRRELEA